MLIPFRKIGSTPHSFEISRDRAKLTGTLVQTNKGFVKLHARLEGTLELSCDLCAENFDTMLNEELTVLLHDGIFHGADEEYDVIEFFDGHIDIDSFLTSELELIRSDYHTCQQCLKP